MGCIQQPTSGRNMAGNQKVSLMDVARAAHVSKSTASLVLSHRSGRIPLTDQSITRVRNAARELGYKPNVFAQGLVSGRSRLHALAVVLPNEQILGSEVNAKVLLGITSKAAEHGFMCNLLVAQSHLDQPLLDHPVFKQRLVEGIVAWQWERADQVYLEEAEQQDIPFVAVHMEVAEGARDILSVNSDDFLNGYRAAEHLLDCGYRAIIFVGGPETSDAALQRRAGVRQCLLHHHLELPPNMTVPGDYLTGDRAAFDRALDRAAQPVGVVAVSDYVAASVLTWIKHKALRIPRDVGVVGFDDEHYAACLEPSLTTVKLHGYQEGQIAAQMVIDMIRGQEVERKQMVVPGELVIRNSTARLSQPNQHQRRTDRKLGRVRKEEKKLPTVTNLK